MEQDKELKAINGIIEILKELNNDECIRVFKYVFDRFDIKNLNTSSVDLKSNFLPQNNNGASIVDIRILKEQKKPKSGIQMVALVAYYLKNIISSDERKDIINTNDVEKYFNQAGFKLPTGKRGSADVLNNAKKAGYLEAIAKNKYRLNPVGYNLVAYGLPEDISNYAKKKNNKKTNKK